MGVNDTHLIDKDNDNEDAEDENVYMYLTDMHPHEWDEYRSTVHASKATKWEHQHYENIVGSNRKMGQSSQPTGTPTTMWKSQSMQHSNQSPPIAPSLYKFSAT